MISDGDLNVNRKDINSSRQYPLFTQNICGINGHYTVLMYHIEHTASPENTIPVRGELTESARRCRRREYKNGRIR